MQLELLWCTMHRDAHEHLPAGWCSVPLAQASPDVPLALRFVLLGLSCFNVLLLSQQLGPGLPGVWPGVQDLWLCVPG